MNFEQPLFYLQFRNVVVPSKMHPITQMKKGGQRTHLLSSLLSVYDKSSGKSLNLFSLQWPVMSYNFTTPLVIKLMVNTCYHSSYVSNGTPGVRVTPCSSLDMLTYLCIVIIASSYYVLVSLASYSPGQSLLLSYFQRHNMLKNWLDLNQISIIAFLTSSMIPLNMKDRLSWTKCVDLK